MGIINKIIQEINTEKDIETRSKIFQVFEPGDMITVPLIQRKCKVGYNTAYRTLKNLIEDDLVESQVSKDDTVLVATIK